MYERHLDRAAALIDLGRFEAARAELAPVLAAEPDNPDAHAQLAYAWLRSGDHAATVDAARTALRLDPAHVFGWKLLAMGEHGLFGAHYDSDRAAALAHGAAAMRAAERSVELDPWQTECHRTLATVTAFHDREAALAAIDTALELEPEDATLHVIRGQVLWQHTRVRSKRAAAGRAAIEEALRLDPDNVEALFLLGNHAVQRRRWAEAESWLRRAAELDPAYGRDVRELLARIPDPASGSVSAPPPERAPAPRPDVRALPVQEPMPATWRAEYLGHSTGTRTGSGGRVLAGIVAALILAVSIALSPDRSASPTTRTPPSRLPGYFGPSMTYVRPSPPPQFPTHLLPPGQRWPTVFTPPNWTPPNWTPPPGGVQAP